MGALYALAVLIRVPSLWHEWPPYLFCDETIFSGDVSRMLEGQVGASDFRAGGVNTYPVLVLWKALEIAGLVSDPTAVLVSGRILMTILVGAAAVVFIYAAARLIVPGRAPAVLAAGSFVASPYVLATSRYWYPDHYLATFGAMAIYAALLIVMRGRSLWRLILLGTAWGLAASTKYSGVFLVVLVVASLGVLAWRESRSVGKGRALLAALRSFLVAAMAALLVFALVNWSAFANGSKFVADFRFNLDNYANNGDSTFLGGLGFNLVVLVVLVFGFMGGAVLAVGIRGIWKASRGACVVMMTTPVALAVYLATNPLVLHRNLTLVVAPVCVGLGVGFAELVGEIKSRGRWRRVLAGVVLAGTAAAVIWVDGRSVMRDFSGDARDSAKEWLAENVREGSSIGINEFCSGASPAEGLGLPLAVDPMMEGGSEYYVLNMYWTSPLKAAYGRSGPFWWLRDQRYSHFYEFGDTQIFPSRAPSLNSLVPQGYRLERIFSGAGPDVVVLRRA